jgi:hypothetical protein
MEIHIFAAGTSSEGNYISNRPRAGLIMINTFVKTILLAIHIVPERQAIFVSYNSASTSVSWPPFNPPYASSFGSPTDKQLASSVDYHKRGSLSAARTD